MVAPWQYIPDKVLDDEKNEFAADKFMMQQSGTIADIWLKDQRAKANRYQPFDSAGVIPQKTFGADEPLARSPKAPLFSQPIKRKTLGLREPEEEEDQSPWAIASRLIENIPGVPKFDVKPVKNLKEAAGQLGETIMKEVDTRRPVFTPVGPTMFDPNLDPDFVRGVRRNYTNIPEPEDIEGGVSSILKATGGTVPPPGDVKKIAGGLTKGGLQARLAKAVAPIEPEPVERGWGPLQGVSQEQQANVTSNPNFQEWFKGSAVANSQGKPVPVYHATRKESDFDEFGHSRDIGFHFGNLSAAYTRSGAIGSGDPDNVKSGAFYLNIRNPLEMRDMSSWIGMAMWDELQKLRVIPPADTFTKTWTLGTLQRKMIPLMKDPGITEEEIDATVNNLWREVIGKYIKNAGYDGVVYDNKYEGGISWIALDPTQIKSATSNIGTFNPVDPSFLRGAAGPGLAAVPQQEGESEETYRARQALGVGLTAGAFVPQFPRVARRLMNWLDEDKQAGSYTPGTRFSGTISQNGNIHVGDNHLEIWERAVEAVGASGWRNRINRAENVGDIDQIVGEIFRETGAIRVIGGKSGEQLDVQVFRPVSSSQLSKLFDLINRNPRAPVRADMPAPAGQDIITIEGDWTDFTKMLRDNKYLAGVVPAVIPQQEGESDEAYQARQKIGAGLAASGLGVAFLKGRAKKTLTNPDANRLMQMYQELPKKAPSPIGPLEATRRDAVRAWTDRMVDLATFQARSAGRVGPLADDEMIAELQRLDPNKSAQMTVQAKFKPALRLVGEDRPELSTHMTLMHNRDVAEAMGQKVTKETAERLAKNPTITPVGVAAQAAISGQRAKETRKFSGGLDLAKTEQSLTDMEAEMGPARMAKVKQAADQIWKLNDELLAERRDAGLINDDLYNTLVARYPHFSRTVIMDYLDDKMTSTPAGKSITVTDNDIRNLTVEGTERAREDPIVSTLRYVYQTRARVMKNNTFNALLKLIDRDPDLANEVMVGQPGIKHTNEWQPVQGFLAGEKVEVLVPKYLAQAMEQEPLSPIPWIGPIMAIWRSLVTSRNPAFLTANALMDAGTYFLRETSRGGGSPVRTGQAVYELLRSYAEIFSDLFISRRAWKGDTGPLAAEYFKAGGGMGGYTNVTPEAGEKAIESLARSNVFEVKSASDLGRLAKDVFTLKPVETLAERIETAPRSASMRMARRRGESALQSTIAGRTVTIDFAQGGNWAKTINGLIPFFNIGMQALVTPIRAAKENPKGFAVTALTALVLPTLVAEWWNRSDSQRSQDYDDVPQYLKDQGLVVMIPAEAPVDAQGNRHPQFLHLRAREYAPIVVATREATNKVMGNDTRKWNELAGGMVQAVSPVNVPASGAGEDWQSTIASVMPAKSDVAMQLAQNRDYYRNRTISNQYSNEAASNFSQWLSQLLGTDPSRVEFATRELGGGVGQSITEASDIISGRERTRAAGAQGVPVAGQMLKRFVRGDVGEKLEQAQRRTLTDENRNLLRQQGIQYAPETVRPAIQDIRLRLSEHARYQQRVNQLINEGIQRVSRQRNWQTLDPETKEQVLREISSAAREQAAIEILRGVGPAGIRQRIQAGAAGAK